MSTIPTSLDLTPSTRILPMLGEIEMELWQCLAELIDNPIDAFLSAEREGAPLTNPEVKISLPARDTPAAEMIIRDNGPGMSLELLNMAVKAGWTSNGPNDNLGLFGMGFNIATARLANRTRILSTRAGDDEWLGVEIDFDKMRSQDTFEAPVVREPKALPTEHGTTIEISNIKPDKRALLVKTTTISNIKKRLSRVYSAMLGPNSKPINFALLINGTALKPHRHCVWSEERIVEHSRFGPVAALQQISFPLAPRRFCSIHLDWLPAESVACSQCGHSEHVRERTRAITGWLGVQRYLSESEFGIDILRNGRKIEMSNRDFFVWQDDDGVSEPEYPIDDPRRRGRLVGEIHFDHGRVNYTKNHFERSDPAWSEMFKLVRGNAPLRPEKAQDAGLGQNFSPLSRLYSTFRRSTPRSAVAGAWQKLLVVKDNELATNWAVKFREGDPAFETDEHWWRAVIQQDEEALIGGGAATPPTPEPGGDSPFPSPAALIPPGPDPGAPDPPAPTRPPPTRIENVALSKEYFDEHSRRRFMVKAYSVKAVDEVLAGESNAWVIKSNANGDHEFFFNPLHQAYQSVTFTPLDSLLAELAAKIVDADRSRSPSFSASLIALRGRYATMYDLNQQNLVGEANRVLGEVAASIARNLDAESARSLYYEIPTDEREAISAKMVINHIHDPLEYINNGRFLEFARKPHIVAFVAEHPELFFDGKYWDVNYATTEWIGSASAAEIARADIVKTYRTWLDDAVWLSESDGGSLTQSSRDRLLRAQMSLRLLSENVVSVEDS
jgi:hypothetical protein